MSLPRKVWGRKGWAMRHLRGIVVSLWIKAWGGSVGKGLQVDTSVRLRHAPSRGWTIGEGVYLGIGTIVDVWPGATLKIGSNTKILHYTTISAHEDVTVGESVQIADGCTVRDNGHGMRAGANMITEKVKSIPVTIEDSSWIGRGSIVLAGSHVAEGAVVGAGSLVTRSTDIEREAIVVGSPARFVRLRNEQD